MQPRQSERMRGGEPAQQSSALDFDGDLWSRLFCRILAGADSFEIGQELKPDREECTDRRAESAAPPKIRSRLFRGPQAQELPIVVADIDETVLALGDQANAAHLTVHEPLFDHNPAISDH